MSKLVDLKPSISELPITDQVELIKTIRFNRRTYYSQIAPVGKPRKIAGEMRAPKKKPGELSAEDKARLLKMLLAEREGQDGSN